MSTLVVTAFTSQLAQLPFCLPKSEAPLNMFDMSVTAAVFHKFVDEVGRFWSKIAAPLNMEAMFSTRAVFQEEMSLLNAAAPSNMEAMDFTFAVFHLSPPCCVCMAWSNFVGAAPGGGHPTPGRRARRCNRRSTWATAA